MRRTATTVARQTVRVILLSILAFGIMLGAVHPALAQSPQDKIYEGGSEPSNEELLEVYRSNTGWYDPSAVCQPGGGGAEGEEFTEADAADRQKGAFEFFLKKGLSPIKAAAIVGNLMQESGPQLDPTVVNSIGATGIAQWLGGRKTGPKGLFAYAEERQIEALNFTTQLNFLWWEISDPESPEIVFKALEGLKAANSLTEAVTVFELRFERAGVDEANIPQRVRYAQSILENYGGIVVDPEEDEGDALDTSDCDVSDLGPGVGSFTDNTSITFDGVNEMLATAQAVSNLNGDTFRTICTNNGLGATNCKALCEYLAASVWGHTNSGYASANTHWNTVKNTSQGHPNDRNVPVGALLYYDTNHIWGHVAVYLGNNKVLSNDVLDGQTGVTGGAYVTDAKEIENGAWHLTYLGWAEPNFPGGLR